MKTIKDIAIELNSTGAIPNMADARTYMKENFPSAVLTYFSDNRSDNCLLRVLPKQLNAYAFVPHMSSPVSIEIHSCTLRTIEHAAWLIYHDWLEIAQIKKPDDDFTNDVPF